MGIGRQPLSPRKSSVDPRSIHAGFVVFKGVIGQICRLVLLFSPLSIILPLLQSYILLTRDTHLMQQFIYYYKQLYMFRAYRCPKHVDLFITINKLLHQVGISLQFHIHTHTSNYILSCNRRLVLFKF